MGIGKTADRKRALRGVFAAALAGAFLLAGCGGGVEKAKKRIEAQLPRGVVSAGPVRLAPMGLELSLPVQVFAQSDTAGRQWQATSDYGNFRLALAVFPDTAHIAPPKELVLRRTRQLLSTPIEPDPLESGELARLKAVSGAFSLLQTESETREGTVPNRMYLIEALRLRDGRTVVLSVDARFEAFDDVEQTLRALAGSLRITPAVSATEG